MPVSSVPPVPPVPPQNSQPSLPSATPGAASTFPVAETPGQPPDWQAYEAHIKSWCDGAPAGADRIPLGNEILAAFHNSEACLDLRERTDIVSLPAGLWVAGSLNLRGCSSLEALPEGLHVGGRAWFAGCTAITALPEGVHIGGDVNIFGCTNLTALPQNFHFGGSVFLQSCSALRELPVLWNVSGNLDISFCTALSRLEVEWNIRGELSAHDCTDLTGMHGSLRVDGGLNFSRCSKFAVFPDILAFGGSINLSFCEEMTALHPSIMTPSDNRNPRVVRLAGSGLPPDVLENLGNNTSIQNVRFDLSVPWGGIESLPRIGMDASVRSPSQTRGASQLTSLRSPPGSNFERAWFYEADHLFEMALTASFNAVSDVPPSRLPSAPMPPYEDLCIISINALEKLGINTEQACPITLEDDVKQPVFVEPAIYEYTALCTHYNGGGVNPLTRLPIDPNEVKRVVT